MQYARGGMHETDLRHTQALEEQGCLMALVRVATLVSRSPNRGKLTRSENRM